VPEAAPATLARMKSPTSKPKPERRWKVVMPISARDGERKRKEAHEARGSAAQPKRRRIAVVARVASREPVNSSLRTARKAAMVQPTTSR